MTMTKLVASMCQNQLITISGISGKVTQIQKEDGSGRCFNVTLQHGQNQTVLFVRTID